MNENGFEKAQHTALAERAWLSAHNPNQIYHSLIQFLLTVYGKNNKDNLTLDEKHILKTIIGKTVDAYKENEHE
ncbi:MAG: hypothetical protein Q8R24_01835 [Legionellaceae bacterium]|nr:hypothetical protein [Legionellaceae bacterium]